MKKFSALAAMLLSTTFVQPASAYMECSTECQTTSHCYTVRYCDPVIGSRIPQCWYERICDYYLDCEVTCIPTGY